MKVSIALHSVIKQQVRKGGLPPLCPENLDRLRAGQTALPYLFLVQL